MAEKQITANLTIDVEGKADYRFEVNAAIEPEWRAQAFEMARQLVTGFGAIARPELLRKVDRAAEIAKMLLPAENLEYPGQPGDRGTTISRDGVSIRIPEGARHLWLGADGVVKLTDDNGDTKWEVPDSTSAITNATLEKLREIWDLLDSQDPLELIDPDKLRDVLLDREPFSEKDQRADRRDAVERIRRLRGKLDARAGKGLDPMFDAEIRAILDGDAADDEPMGMVEIDKRGMYGGEFQQISHRHHFNSMTPNAQCVHCQTPRRAALVDYDTRICRSVDG